jgi:putative flippase GtrA
MRKASSFALIGAINTVVDIVVFLTAYKILNLPLLPANLLAWIVAVSGSYVLNSLFTFAAESGRRLSLRFYVSFVASGVAGFISNTTTLWLASFFAPVAIAKAIAIGASFMLNFSLSHFVVFKHGRARTEESLWRAPRNGYSVKKLRRGARPAVRGLSSIIWSKRSLVRRIGAL